MKCIDSALSEKRTQMPKRFYYNRLPRMPQGVRESIEAVRPAQPTL